MNLGIPLKEAIGDDLWGHSNSHSLLSTSRMKPCKDDRNHLMRGAKQVLYIHRRGAWCGWRLVANPGLVRTGVVDSIE